MEEFDFVMLKARMLLILYPGIRIGHAVKIITGTIRNSEGASTLIPAPSEKHETRKIYG